MDKQAGTNESRGRIPAPAHEMGVFLRPEDPKISAPKTPAPPKPTLMSFSSTYKVFICPRPWSKP